MRLGLNAYAEVLVFLIRDTDGSSETMHGMGIYTCTLSTVQVIRSNLIRSNLKSKPSTIVQCTLTGIQRKPMKKLLKNLWESHFQNI